MNITNFQGALRMVGIIAFFATMPIYSPNIVPLFAALADSDLTGSFVWALMIATALASAVLAVLALSGRAKGTLSGRMADAVMLAYPIATVCFYLMLLGFLPYSIPIAGALGALSGALFVPCAVVWAKTLSPCPLENAILLVCVACGTSAVLNWFSTYLSAIPLAVLYTLLLATCIVAYFADGRAHADDSPNEDAHLPLREVAPRFVSVMAPALIGLSMFAFFMGVSRPSIGESLSADVAGTLLAAITLAPLCMVARRLRHPMQTFFHQLLLPLLATAVMAMFIMLSSAHAEFAHVATQIAVYYFFGVAALYAVSLSIAGASAREFPPTLVLSAIVGCFAVFSLAGIQFGALSSFAHQQTLFMPSIVVALYCVFLIVYSIVAFWRNTSPQVETPIAVEEPVVETIEQRCGRIADEFGLSPRERELLAYLGRGHTASYIAKTLVISESTVYTHTRNIYQKVGIGSREELLAMIEEGR